MCNVPDELRNDIAELCQNVIDRYIEEIEYRDNCEKAIRVHAWVNSLPEMPQEDWSQAPEWVGWIAYENGRRIWFDKEPVARGQVWVESQECRKHQIDYDAPELPIGIDWRLTKQRRPE